MIIELSEIPPEGQVFEGEEPAGILELPEAGDLRAASPIAYSFRADLVTDELIVRGQLAVSVEFVCSRCAEAFVATIVEPDFNCARDVGEAPGSETEPQGAGKGRHAGKEKARCVDLTGDIREAILLAFPSHPVCSAGCKGLCAQCGVNLNFDSCDCRPPGDNRWGALDGLVVKKGI